MGLYDFTIYSLIERNAKLYANHAAWISEEEKITHRQLLEKVCRLSGGLLNAGIQKGDRIGVLALNCLEFVYLYGAAAKIGAIMVPINWRLQPEEVEYIIKDATPKMVFADAECQKLSAPLVSNFDFIEKSYSMGPANGEFASFQDLLAGEDDCAEVDICADDAYVIIHTAAVAGKPRGAILAHKNLIAANLQSIYNWNLTPKDCYMCVLPLFHIAALGACLNVMHAGGANVLLPKFEPDPVLKHIQENKVSLFIEFPPMLSTLLERNKDLKNDLSSLRILGGFGTPEIVEQYEKTTGGTFWTGFGQTETASIITYGVYKEKPGSAGYPGVLTDMEIMDDYGNFVETGRTGEIVVRGPLVFKGYWNLEKETEYTLRNGWHHTGDMGRLDEDGCLFYAGRMPEKELIKSGGENVYPAEVEKAILGHPLVEEVSVIGVRDKKWGEAVKAVCVLKKGEELAESELAEFVASKIARYKKPQYVVYVSGLPKAEDGSIDRAKVKREHELSHLL
jgi:long-chain acyl-CoA synthetase